MRPSKWTIFFYTIAFLDLLTNYALAEPLSTAAAILWGSGIAGGAGILGSILGKSDNPTQEITQLPEFEEAEGARKLWWEKLQGWGSDPNYGAISPDWESIWQQAMDKVNAYYQGTPTGQGMFDKVKSSFAARNTSESPAMTRSLARLGAEQAGQIKDLAATQSIAKNEFSEQGRQNWLKSLMGLTSVRPNYNVAPANNSGIGSAIAGIGGSIGGSLSQYAMQKQQQDWISGLLNNKSTSDVLTSPNTWNLSNNLVF